MSSLQEEACFSELTTQRRCITESQPPYRIVHVNAAWCGTTGYPRESALSLTPQVLVGPETCSQTLQVRFCR
jgi:PAS domain-containing protein